MVFGVFSPGRTQCIAPKKLPDKAMSIWNLHKKFQLSSAMGLRDFDLQSQPTLMGGNPLIVVHCGNWGITKYPGSSGLEALCSEITINSLFSQT